jgi:hypothetical protein
VSQPWPKTIPQTFGLLVVALALGAAATCSPGLAAETSVPAPFTGTALWVTQIPVAQTGQQLAAEAAAAGVRTLYVKAAEGSSPEAQFSAALVSEMRAAGASVCAWTFAYGQNPWGEAAAAVAAVRDGAQCLVVDAEGQYDKLYGAAQLFVRTLRAQLGAGFPIALAGEAEILRHPTFPYSVFLGPGAFNVFLPEIYWLELGVSVDAAYAATLLDRRAVLLRDRLALELHRRRQLVAARQPVVAEQLVALDLLDAREGVGSSTRARPPRAPAARASTNVGVLDPGWRPTRAPGSSTSSATLYGRASPMQIACPDQRARGLERASMFAGDMFLPAALMISSFLRSTIFR